MILTRNGEADLVVISHEAFRRMEARNALQSKLLVAEKQVAEGEELPSHEQVMTKFTSGIYLK